MAEEGIWEVALAADDVEWCRGPGCSSGSTVQHQRGFATATRVHLAEAPPEDDSAGSRAALHRALTLVGRVAAGREPGSVREHQVAAFDGATQAMRDAGVSVPRSITSQRPSPTAPERVGTVEAPAVPDLENADAADTEDDG
jgi:hypothetical protein